MESYQWIILYFFCFISSVVRGQDVTIMTNAGTFVGEVHHGSFNTTPFVVCQFLGIPFAEPPIGERRFRKPVPKTKSSEPYIAKTMSSQCIQNFGYRVNSTIANMSEDCLYLNVLVPGINIDATNKKAVMVWIYGGAFQVGAQDVYTSPTFAAMNDVILVTMNYRVSIFGFISTGEDHLPGNQGLWDQQMAIKWVHDNIENFGGDTNRITIFGESAGGASVVYQALYGGNRGLFQRIIAQSGSANLKWAFTENPIANFDEVVYRTDCRVGTVSTVIDCLRNKTTEEIQTLIFDMETFYPVHDGDFVRIPPEDVFQNRTDQAAEILADFGKLHCILGVTSDEGVAQVLLIDEIMKQQGHDKPFDGYTPETFENMMINWQLSRLYPNTQVSKALRKAIVHQYTDWADANSTIRMRKNVIDFLSDSEINTGMITTANAHTDTGDGSHTYFYVYDHQLSYLPPASERGYDGAAHSEELPILFGLDKSIAPPGVPDDPATILPDHEVLLSKQVMEYWTTFAKSGSV